MLGFLATAGLHASGYSAVTRAAARLPGLFGAALPALWLAFSIDLLIVGGVVALVALRPGPAARPIVGLAAACPLGAALLQIRFIGFIPPTAILLALALVTLAAALAGFGESGSAAGPRRPSELQGR